MPLTGQSSTPQITTSQPTAKRRFCILLVFSVSLLFGLWVVTACGALGSDLGGDPDEAAHAVTSLMVRDYLAMGFMQPPMKFANAYYDSFPRVALGHYPPGYYLLTAPLLLIWPSVKVLFILQAVLLATLAAAVAHHVAKLTNLPLAAIAGLSVTILPVSLQQCQLVMSDLLLAVVCLVAAMSWRRYLQNPTMRRALSWGCIAAAAILTKGSGMGLCLMPPVATLLAGRWRLFGTLSWWSSAAPVAILAGPWMLYSTHISKEGMTQMSPLQYLQEALPYYLNATPIVFGWPLTVLAFWGVVAGGKACFERRACTPASAAMVSLAAGMSAVLLLVPVGLTSRYMLTLVPLMVMAAAYGLHSLTVPAYLKNSWIKPLVLGAASLLPLLSSGLPEKTVLGFTSAVNKSFLSLANAPRTSWLIASDPRGEGAIIAAATFACPQRSPSPLRVLRGSKELSTSDWMGRGYVLAFQTVPDLLAHLDKLKVSRVFVDMSVPPDRWLSHHQLLLSAMQSGDSRWQLEFEKSITRGSAKPGSLLVYERTEVKRDK